MNKELELSKSEELNKIGLYFVENEKYDEALKYFKLAINEDEKYLDAHYNIALLYLITEEFEESIQYYDMIIKNYPMEGYAYFQRGNLYYHVDNNLEEAIKMYNKAMFLGEKDINLFYNLGQCFFDMKNYEQSISWIERAIRLNDSRSDLYNKKASSLIELGRFEEALECYDKALMIEFDNEESNHFKAIVLGEIGREKDAFNLLDNIESIVGRKLLYSYDRALLFEKLGQLENALKELEICEEIEKYNLEVLKKKALIYLALEDTVNALKTYDYILENDINNFEIIFSKANIYMMTKEYKAAYEMFKKIIIHADKEDPYKINSYYYKALALKLDGDSKFLDEYEEASREYSKLLLYYPYDFNLYMLKGNSLRDIDKNKEAEEAYKYAMDLNSDMAELYIMRAKNRIKLGNVKGVKEDIDNAISLQDYFKKLIEEDDDLKLYI
ncbi:tetratricopeptide repeat protein [Clostridium sp.]|uniref:tetratricopeptide repeat protein n=1 Tax=Clostridium sp. TaxID=1506 RepID=UPI001ECB3953|nr:tetratricopeptide repeat protein [Clostridium sp.]MBS5886730.1 tetratricopeptide repeat protein [Clostridium sp.]